MNSGIQKYLAIFLGAILFSASSVSATTQELKATSLPFKPVGLIFRKGNTLLTARHADLLDIVITHLRHKPHLNLTVCSYPGTGSSNTDQDALPVAQQRLKMTKAYLLDSGAKENRISFNVKSIKSGGMCNAHTTGIHITAQQ